MNDIEQYEYKESVLQCIEWISEILDKEKNEEESILLKEPPNPKNKAKEK